MSETVIAHRLAGASRLEIDIDPRRLDVAAVHHFLADCSHWARGVPRATVQRAIDHSLCFGLYRDGAQIGFARVVTDHATFAYLADVFVVAGLRGDGLGRWLVETILAHPPLHGLRRWLLVTRDARSLYLRCGFADPVAGLSYLERFDRDVYAIPAEAAASA